VLIAAARVLDRGGHYSWAGGGGGGGVGSAEEAGAGASATAAAVAAAAAAASAAEECRRLEKAQFATSHYRGLLAAVCAQLEKHVTEHGARDSGGSLQQPQSRQQPQNYPRSRTVEAEARAAEKEAAAAETGKDKDTEKKEEGKRKDVTEEKEKDKGEAMMEKQAEEKENAEAPRTTDRTTEAGGFEDGAGASASAGEL
jgi:hypothetical protein